MKKKILLLISIFFIVVLTGCNRMSKEENKEIERIEKDTKLIMIDYLQDNYNISNVSEVNAMFYPGDSTFGNSFEEFSGYVGGKFKKNNINYTILCEYDTKKCYDGYAYEVKVNPFLTEYLNNILKEKDSKFNFKIDYAYLNYDKYKGFSKAFDSNYVGVFNNYDEVNNIEEIWNYFDSNIRYLRIIYDTSDKFIVENSEVYSYLQKKLNLKLFVESYYNNGVENEFLGTNGSSYYEAYINEMVEVDNYIVYRNHVVYERRGGVEVKKINISDVKYGEFEVNIVNNGTIFEPIIELYEEEYKLYNSNILEVKNVGKEEIVDDLYFQLKDNVCKTNRIVYNKLDGKDYISSNNGVINSLVHEYDYVSSTDSGEVSSVRYFAIYCKSE